MAVTRLKRKDRKNKVVAKQRVKDIKKSIERVYIKSPYKDVSGIILEDNN